MLRSISVPHLIELSSFTISIGYLYLKLQMKKRISASLLLTIFLVSKHCASAYFKANKILGMIKRTIISRESRLLLSLYKTLVRPHLEYCSSAWSPHHTTLPKGQKNFWRRYRRIQRSFYNNDNWPEKVNLRQQTTQTQIMDTWRATK